MNFSPASNAVLLNIVNPLPRTLQHYQEEFVQTLERVGATYLVQDSGPVEGLAGTRGRLLMLRNAVRNARSGAMSPGTSIQLWPSLGLLEPILWLRSRAVQQNMILLHDPVPLRRQPGFGRSAQALAKRLPADQSPVIVTHSRDAHREARRMLPRLRHQIALHPILSDQSSTTSNRSQVVVAGQFKPERDLELLERIGRPLQARGWDTVIYGSGWPSVTGWRSVDKFLSEDELDAAIDRAAILVIPYKSYFQSGVAIRALERGVISVGPSNSFSRTLFGDDAPFLYGAPGSPADILNMIESALEYRSSAHLYFDSYKMKVDASWRELLF